MKGNRVTKSFLFALAIAVGAAGCAAEQGGGNDPQPPVEGDAYLVIQGDTNVFLENGWTQTLTVRYQSGDGQSLAGQVDFEVVGASAGGSVSKAFAVTDSDGVATIEVMAGAEGDASFKVRASADYADAAEWSIAVNGGTPPLPPLDPQGRYRVDSEFNVVAGIPGTAGQVLNTFADITDGTYDPATWLLDFIIDKIDNSTIEGFVSSARPLLDGVLNDALHSLAPDFVNKILDIGNKFGQVGHNFGLRTTMEVTSGGIEGGDMSLKHTLTGMFVNVDGNRYDFSTAELGMSNQEATASFRMNEIETQVTIGQHEFPVSYGALLSVALEQVIIPSVDPQSSSLQELFSHLINCNSVAQELYDYIASQFGWGGSVGLYEGACELGLTAAANAIMDKIHAIDANGLIIQMGGTAKPLDTNSDRKVDVLRNGEWDGTMSYAGTPADYTGAEFDGQRMVTP